MIRSLVYSALVHFALFLALVFVSALEPSRKPVKPSIRAGLIPRPPAGLPGLPPGPPIPPLPPPPKPKTAEPKPKAPETKKAAEPAKTSTIPAGKPKTAKDAPKKEVIKKEREIVEAAPTPSPTPAPKEIAMAEPEAKPEEPKKDEKKGEKDKPPAAPAAELPGDLAAPASKTSAEPGPSIDMANLPPLPPGFKLPEGMKPGGGLPGGVPGGGGPVTAGAGFADLGTTYAYWAVFMIQQNFKPAYSMPGVKCVVGFNIQKDGTLTDPKIIASSGRSDLDQTALRALQTTGKVMPLYEGYTRPFMAAEVTFDFEKTQ